MHVAIVLLAWLSTLYAPEPIQFISYEIELVSPPPARQAEEPEPAAEELVVERPDPEPTPPEPEVEEIASKSNAVFPERVTNWMSSATPSRLM